MNAPLFFAAAGDERGTPRAFFDQLNAEFQFTLDAAASTQNHKCDLWFGEGGVEPDALAADWGGEGSSVFLNPPYSIAAKFVAKAREEADKGATVVMLLPVRSDTKYWQRYVWDRDMSRARGAVEMLPGGMPKYGPLVTHTDGDFRPGVRCRFLPGRLAFELSTTPELRAWIAEQCPGGAPEISRGHMADLIEVTGLPRIAIVRILQGNPDSKLLDAAPFPSCVVVFTKAS